jgi:signal transduction histidine kinase
MGSLPRPGLRARLVAVLVLTAALTLAVAALTLLSPLERRLRDQEVRALAGAAVASRPTFEELTVSQIRRRSPRLKRVAEELARRTQGRVALLDSRGRTIVDTDPDGPRAVMNVTRALRTNRPLRRIAPGGSGEARVGARVEVDGHRFVLFLRKELGDVASAKAAVLSAVTRAAWFGLAVAVILGAGLATAIVRRLRRLRTAALELGAPGTAAQLPVDTARDEVGDLSRAFAEMRTRLARQEDVRRAFVATASHELRTPLTSLSGRLELAQDDLAAQPPDVAGALEQLAGAREQSDRIARLASDLLDLSRIDAELELRREPFELGELGRAVIAELEPRARERGVPVRLDAASPHWAAADPSATARVLRILLDNAYRYAPAGTEIGVSAQERNGAATLSVADRGPGIASTDREKIFERFTRGGDAMQEGGFGLGLAIGRELARHMGGSLEIEGDGPGATFVLALPRADGHGG